MKRLKVSRVLLLVGVLVLSVWLIVEYHAVVVLLKSFWQWSLGSVHVVGAFVKRVAAQALHSFVTRQVLKPIWVALGLVWLTSYLSKSFRRTFGVRISTSIKRLSEVWRSLPWYLKAVAVLGVVAMVFFLGWGLWLIPFGLPFYGTIMGRVKASWADSWIRKKTQSARWRIRAFVRRNRDSWHVGSFRSLRYWLIRRDRTWSARVDQAVKTVAERRLG